MGFFKNPVRTVQKLWDGKSSGAGGGMSRAEFRAKALAAQQAQEAAAAKAIQAASLPQTPAMPVKNPTMLANEELLRNLQQQMYFDENRLKGQSAPIYQGKTISPMSSMTQNARQIREHYAGKQAPKREKIETLLKREGEGFKPEQLESMLDMIKRGDSSQNAVLERLQKQFGKNWGYENERAGRVQGKITKDIDNTLGMSRANLGKVSNQIAELENKRSLQGVEALRNAGALKTARREGLINQLDEFGNQQHHLNNLKLKSQRDSFEEEANSPYLKLAKAQQALQGLDGEETHPDKAQIQNQLLQKVRDAYNRPHTNYPGQRVVGITPETEASFDVVNRISPKYKDAYHQDRKNIQNDLMNNPMASQIYNKLPESVNPLMENLDYLTQKQLKKTSKQIGGQYARLGTYGSGAHKAATESALRDVMRRVQNEREGAVLTGLKEQGKNVGTKAQNDLHKYNLMANEGAFEFADLLNTNKKRNKLGWDKRANEQAAENENMQQWYGQSIDEWPTLQKMIQSQGFKQGVENGNKAQAGLMTPFSNLAKQYGTDLSSLFNMPAVYSEAEKDYNAYATNAQRDIDNYKKANVAYNQKQAQAAAAQQAQAAQAAATQQSSQAAAQAAAAQQASQAQAQQAAERQQREAEWHRYVALRNDDYAHNAEYAARTGRYAYNGPELFSARWNSRPQADRNLIMQYKPAGAPSSWPNPYNSPGGPWADIQEYKTKYNIQ